MNAHDSSHSDLLDNTHFGSESNPAAHSPKPHVNARSIYYKGLLGMIFCIAPAAFIGLVFVKLCLDQAKEAMEDIRKNPDGYTQASKKEVRQGRTMGLIGLSLFILEIVVLVGYMSMH